MFSRMDEFIDSLIKVGIFSFSDVTSGCRKVITEKHDPEKLPLQVLVACISSCRYRVDCRAPFTTF